MVKFQLLEQEIFRHYRENAQLYTHKGESAKWIGRAINLCGSVYPPLAENIAWKIFAKPRSPKLSEAELTLRGKASMEWIKLENGKKIAVYEWGNGPLALLAHGWESRATRHVALITALVEAGWKVIAFDAPGHGMSTGETTDAREMSHCLGLAVEKRGMAEIAIGHSLGALALCHALKREKLAKRAVFAAIPSLFSGLTEKFCRSLNLRDKIREGIEKRMGDHFSDLGPHYSKILSAYNDADKISVPILLTHDENDRIVSLIESRMLADMLPKARLMITRGLGHGGILRDAGAIKEILAFSRMEVEE